MLQFFMFFIFLSVFCLISLRLKFLENDEGLSRDKVTCYDHLMSYMFWYYKYKHVQIQTSFLKIFVIF